MTLTKFAKTAGAGTAFGLVVLAGVLVNAPSGEAQDWNNHGWNDHESRVRIGFSIAPVPLNLKGKDRELVGLGSYWVNAVSDCNFCHTAGPPRTLILPMVSTRTSESARKPTR